MKSKTAKRPKFNIRQSLIKAYLDYKDKKACGILFEKQYITQEIQSEPTEAMKLGQYFEYRCTGQPPKSGERPVPDTTQKGELTAPYKRAFIQAENFKSYIDKLGIKIVQTGVNIVKDGLECTLDIVADWGGELIIIDLKLSGLLYNKWDEQGWDLDALQYKHRLLIQALHYNYITDMPFYFFVFSSTNEIDCELIKVEIDPELLAYHERRITDIQRSIEFDLTLGFEAYPDLARCKECPLFETCNFKTEVPILKTVHYTFS